MIRFMRPGLLLLAVCLTACSSSKSSNDKQSKAPAIPAHFTATNTSNSLAKYVELVGFRINEKSPGKLQVQFGVVNHSEADIGDMKLEVHLATTAAKPGDPPLITFPVTVSSLGPLDLKNVSVEVPTKLRVYELPDWQFLKAEFQITEPQ
jgi:predicted component of type VI protein secretion system